jgi:hypothetical protein
MDCNTAPYNTTYCVRSCTTIHIQHSAQTWALKGCARQSEKAAKLAQKLGQLQPFLAILPQKEMGQLAHFGPT